MPTVPRILLIAPQPFFQLRGTPINVRAMAETLVREQICEVDLVVYPLGERIELDGVTIHRCTPVPLVSEVPAGPSFRKAILDVSLLAKALQLALTRKFDLFHGVEEGAFIAATLARLQNRPFVYDMDSCMETQLRDSTMLGSNVFAEILAVLEARTMKRAAAVVTVCEALSRRAKSRAPETPVFQIEDFPSDGADQADPSVVASLRSEFSIDGNQRIVLYSGNFERYQGLDLLLKSFAHVQNDCNVRLFLVGGGGPGKPQFEHYQRLAKSLGISSRVVFCGNRPQAEMGAFMQLADVLVSPRILGENTPLKLYSYLAAGKPLVATAIYSHTQVVSSEHAYLAEPNDEAFGAALRSALDYTVLAQLEQRKKADAAKLLVQRHYSRDAFEARLVELYSTLLQTAPAADDVFEFPKRAVG